MIHICYKSYKYLYIQSICRNKGLSWDEMADLGLLPHLKSNGSNKTRPALPPLTEGSDAN